MHPVADCRDRRAKNRVKRGCLKNSYLLSDRRVTEYVYAVFVSYRQVGRWKPWVREVFVPALQDCFDRDIPKAPKIYVDERIEAGANWKYSLNNALVSSKVMVPVFMASYFDSINCRLELSHMLEREEMCGLRSVTTPDGLIVPARISERDYFPDRAIDVLDYDFTDFNLPHFSKDADNYGLFEKKMNLFVKVVYAAMKRAKPFDSVWAQIRGDKYEKELVTKPFQENATEIWAA